MGSLATTAPTGTVAQRPASFTGSYTRTLPTDALGPLELVEIELFRHETSHVGEETLWTVNRNLSSSDVASDTFETDFPALSLLNDDYCWRARVRDSSGVWSSWTAKQVFMLSAAAPVLSNPNPAEAAPSLLAMVGYHLSFDYTDAVDSPPSKVTCRMYEDIEGDNFDRADENWVTMIPTYSEISSGGYFWGNGSNQPQAGFAGFVGVVSNELKVKNGQALLLLGDGFADTLQLPMESVRQALFRVKPDMFDGYAAEINFGNCGIELADSLVTLIRSQDGGDTGEQVAAPASYGETPNWVWVRLEDGPDLIKVRMWLDGDTEPGTWLLTRDAGGQQVDASLMFFQVNTMPSATTIYMEDLSFPPGELVWYHDLPPREWDGTRVGLRYCGKALTEGSTYTWYFTATNAYGATSNEMTGSFTLINRTVPGSGPVETLSDTWRELWRTYNVTRPVGLWYDSGNPDVLYALDRQNKNLATIRQSDRVVIQSDYLGAVINYPAGLSGDPTDSTVFWVLDAPWSQGAGGNAYVRCLSRADFSIVASYNVGATHWSAVKVSDSYIYLTNYANGEITRYDKATGLIVGSWTITYESVLQTQPTGIMIDGSTLYYFFYNDGSTRRFLIADESDVSTITGAKSTEGTFLLGGEMDTTTHREMYGDQDTDNLVAKFTLTEPQYSDGTPATRLRAAMTSYADA